MPVFFKCRSIPVYFLKHFCRNLMLSFLIWIFKMKNILPNPTPFNFSRRHRSICRRRTECWKDMSKARRIQSWMGASSPSPSVRQQRAIGAVNARLLPAKGSIHFRFFNIFILIQKINIIKIGNFDFLFKNVKDKIPENHFFRKARKGKKRLVFKNSNIFYSKKPKISDR